MSLPLYQRMSFALSAHLAGETALAIERYQEILADYPWQPDTHFLLGVAHFQTRRDDWGFHHFNIAFNCDAAVADRHAFFYNPVPLPRDYRNIENEHKLLAAAAEALAASRQPIKIQFGAGSNAKPDFLNLDRYPFPALIWSCWVHRHPDRFFAHNLDLPLPLPDGSVDFVFSEDFIEHLSQKAQVKYLAETFRVLRPGAAHRISTPCLRHSMAKHSNFAAGVAGVWAKEWDAWEHVALFTRETLADMARMIGYCDVIFTGKNESTSPHRCEEIRPGLDRPEPEANIFADLIK